MNVRKAAVRTILSLLTLASLSAARVFPDEPPVIVHYYERPPFFGRVDTLEEGFILKITRLIFLEAKIPFVFMKTPVTRIFRNMEEPGLHCCPGVFRNAEREKRYVFSQYPIYQDSKPHYVIRKDQARAFAGIATIKDLLTSGRTLGTVKDYSYGTWIDENLRSHKHPEVVVNIGDDQAGFYKMLTAGRFDYFFASLEEANYVIRSDPVYAAALRINTLDDAPAGNIRWLLFNKDFPKELSDTINRALAEVRRSERYLKIIADQQKMY